MKKIACVPTYFTGWFFHPETATMWDDREGKFKNVPLDNFGHFRYRVRGNVLAKVPLWVAMYLWGFDKEYYISKGFDPFAGGKNW